MSGLGLTFGWIAAAVAGRIVSGDPGLFVDRISIDTRSLEAGDLFIALRGHQFDGHAFVEQAIHRGAIGAIVQAEVSLAPSEGPEERITGDRLERLEREVHPKAILEVGDTTIALQDLAHAVREAASTKVIAITGSAGKTTTKEIIADFLSGSFRVVKNKGNLNNHIGLPLSLLQLRDKPDIAVMELGMSRQGEISTLVAIADPDVRVWTNVGDAHLGGFESLDALADAKAEILESAEPHDLLVCNADDPRVMTRAAQFTGRTVTFGENPAATVRASNVQDRGIDGMRAEITTPAGTKMFETPLLGRGNLSNLLAAIAVALDCGVSLDEIAARAAALRPADRRGVVHRLRDGIVLIDDSYNASPAALDRALEVVEKEDRVARKVAVLGEMLELGDRATALHEESGRRAVAANVGLLFAVGGAPARALADAAVAAGMPAVSVRYIEKSEDAAPLITAALRPGDLVLVKGSRGTRMDVIADRIAGEHG